MAYSLLIGYKGEMKPITSTATAALPDDLPLLDIVNINFMGATNVYDGNGSMVKSTVNEITTYYIGGYYELKIDGTTETETKYYTGPTGRFAMRVEGTLYWIFSDHLQSSSVILDEVGNVINRTDYTAFGEVRAETGTSPTDYQYTGQRSYLDSFDLHYYVARWYDPVTAHFAQADSIIPQPGNSGDWNRYAYVLYNPMRYIDPTGHYYVDDIIPGLTNDSSWWSYQNPNLQVRFDWSVHLLLPTPTPSFLLPSLEIILLNPSLPLPDGYHLTEEYKVTQAIRERERELQEWRDSRPKLGVSMICSNSWADIDQIDFGVDAAGITTDTTSIIFPPIAIIDYLSTGVEILDFGISTYNFIFTGDPVSFQSQLIDAHFALGEQALEELAVKAVKPLKVIGILASGYSMYREFDCGLPEITWK